MTWTRLGFEMNKQKFTILVGLCLAAVVEKGDFGLPSGHLYAVLLDKCTLSEYEAIIETMKDAGWITEDRFLLKVTPKGLSLGSLLVDAMRAS